MTTIHRLYQQIIRSLPVLIFILALFSTSHLAAGAPQPSSTGNTAPPGSQNKGSPEPIGAGNILEEIIVTAQRRQENLQKISLAITAFTQTALDRMGAIGIDRIDLLTPGLEYGQFGSGTRLSIRGMGSSSLEATVDSPVGVFVDGVYQSRGQQAFLALQDVERIEVLRGPQGTLFGRNTTAGSINVVSAMPSEEFEAFGDVMYGNYDQIVARGTVNMPINDQVQSRFSVLYQEHDPFIENTFPGGTGLMDEEQVFVKGAVRFSPNEDLDIVVRATYWDQGGDGYSFAGHKFRTNGPLGNTLPGFWEGICTLPLAFGGFGLPPGTCVNNDPRITPFGAFPADVLDPQSITWDQIGQRDVSQWTINAEIAWDFPAFQVKSITGYADYDQFTGGDSDFSDVTVWQISVSEDVQTFQQEIHISSRETEPWQWLVGFFYLNDQIREELLGELIGARGLVPAANLAATPFLFPRGNRVLTNDRMGDVETDAWAIFGQASYYISDQIRITFGGRYSEDDKSFKQISFEGAGRGNLDLNKKFTEFTWKTGIDWFWHEDNMLYFTASTGFLAGGFNRFTPIPTSPVQSVFYSPETILNFELGSKNRFADDRLQINALIFYNEITDQQVYTFDTSIPSSVIDNSGSSDTLGVEIEMQAIPTDRLFITASLAYLDAVYLEWDGFSDGSPGVSIDVAGNQRITSPEWTASITASYEIPLGERGTLTPYIQFAFKDEYFVTPLNDPFLDRQESYTQTDLRLRWESADGHWNAEAFVQNIEDEFPLNGAFFAFGGMFLTAGPEPRTYGFRIGYRN